MDKGPHLHPPPDPKRRNPDALAKRKDGMLKFMNQHFKKYGFWPHPAQAVQHAFDQKVDY